jgi:hypothetical protein
MVKGAPFDMANPSVRIDVEASRDSTSYELIVEPWGEAYDISESTPAVVFFSSKTDRLPEVGVMHGPNFVIVCANGGIDDFRVEDRTGNPLIAR